MSRVLDVRHIGPELTQRFWLKVNVLDSEDCWGWTGYRYPNGYGQFNVNRRHEYTHRLALALKLGGILPAGMHACHTCDNPQCCNPRHLFAGTQKQNLADMKSKGRSAIGAKNGATKLTAPEVLAIRVGLNSGATQQALADAHGVTRLTIHKIAHRKTWAHLPEAIFA